VKLLVKDAARADILHEIRRYAEMGRPTSAGVFTLLLQLHSKLSSNGLWRALSECFATHGSSD
jgi:hypothetical protein